MAFITVCLANYVCSRRPDVLSERARWEVFVAQSRCKLLYA